MRPLRSAVLASLALAHPAGAEERGDTWFGYRHGNRFQEPSNPLPVEKHVLSWSHAGSYAYGGHYLNVDVFLSDRNDPAAGAGSGGAQEIYLTYRHHLSLGKLRGRPLAFGPVRDLALSAGLDLNAKDTAFAPRKRAVVLGPTFSFAVPAGFWDLGLWLYKERNHNGLGVVKEVDFRTTWILSSSWGVPIRCGPLATTFKGFANRVGPRGKDGARVETVTETLVRSSWMIDAGALAGARKGTWLLGPGVEYWQHKFGNPSPIPAGDSSKPNLRTLCPTLQAEIHF